MVSSQPETPMRIGFVAKRIGGTDGVSLEIEKWATVLERLGHTCYYIAGEVDRPTFRSQLIPEAQFRHPTVRAIDRECFLFRNGLDCKPHARPTESFFTRGQQAMKPILKFSVLTSLIVAAPSLCFAMESIGFVSKGRAKELGMEIRSRSAGPDAVRVELEFETRGKLKNYSRVALEMRDRGRLLLSATLREEQPKPGRIVVGFVADRRNLDKLTLKVVVERRSTGRIGHVIRVKKFVDLEKVR